MENYESYTCSIEEEEIFEEGMFIDEVFYDFDEQIEKLEYFILLKYYPIHINEDIRLF